MLCPLHNIVFGEQSFLPLAGSCNHEAVSTSPAIVLSIELLATVMHSSDLELNSSTHGRWSGRPVITRLARQCPHCSPPGLDLKDQRVRIYILQRWVQYGQGRSNPWTIVAASLVTNDLARTRPLGLQEAKLETRLLHPFLLDTRKHNLQGMQG